MKIDVQLFAAAREVAGKSPVSVELPEGATVADLRGQLVEETPKLKSLAGILFVAVNNQYAGDSQVLTLNDAVACFPPVSGG
jgi:molybdopterin converting factor subunit 1